jgi:phosphotriesterase-related protein
MTVTGARPVAELGRVLPHEHVLCNTMQEYRGNGLVHDERLAVSELQQIADKNTTLVDVTLASIGRDPAALRRVAEASGVTIVMGCGDYRDPYLDPARLDRLSVDHLADELVAEIEHGVGDTGVRPGVIGEIGADKWYVSAAEERALRAAARAQKRTGLTLSTHSARWPVADAQLAILAEEGVDPRRVIVGHSDTVPDPDFHVRLAERGCFVEFDSAGTGTAHDDRLIVEYVVNMAAHGHMDKVLLSQDVFLLSHLTAHGGNGYNHLFTTVADQLRAAGIEEEQLHQLFVVNPANALTGGSL